MAQDVFIDFEFMGMPSGDSPEERLWKAVIITIFQDTYWIMGRIGRSFARHGMIHENDYYVALDLWREVHGKHLGVICELAGVDPDLVRRQAIKELESCAWGDMPRGKVFL